MLAWQCRMAFSMLDDVPYFFALGYQVDMTLFEIFTCCWNTSTELYVNAFNQTQHKAFACFVEYDSKRN
jgi:hypothetical protein